MNKIKLIKKILIKKIKGKKKTKNLKNNNRDVRAYARPHK
jgi:hypothetical protein